MVNQIVVGKGRFLPPSIELRSLTSSITHRVMQIAKYIFMTVIFPIGLWEVAKYWHDKKIEQIMSYNPQLSFIDKAVNKILFFFNIIKPSMPEIKRRLGSLESSRNILRLKNQNYSKEDQGFVEIYLECFNKKIKYYTKISEGKEKINLYLLSEMNQVISDLDLMIANFDRIIVMFSAFNLKSEYNENLKKLKLNKDLNESQKVIIEILEDNKKTLNNFQSALDKSKQEKDFKLLFEIMKEFYSSHVKTYIGLANLLVSSKSVLSKKDKGSNLILFQKINLFQLDKSSIKSFFECFLNKISQYELNDILFDVFLSEFGARLNSWSDSSSIEDSKEIIGTIEGRINKVFNSNNYTKIVESISKEINLQFTRKKSQEIVENAVKKKWYKSEAKSEDKAVALELITIYSDLLKIQEQINNAKEQIEKLRRLYHENFYQLNDKIALLEDLQNNISCMIGCFLLKQTNAEYCFKSLSDLKNIKLKLLKINKSTNDILTEAKIICYDKPLVKNEFFKVKNILVEIWDTERSYRDMIYRFRPFYQKISSNDSLTSGEKTKLSQFCKYYNSLTEDEKSELVQFSICYEDAEKIITNFAEKLEYWVGKLVLSSSAKEMERLVNKMLLDLNTSKESLKQGNMSLLDEYIELYKKIVPQVSKVSSIFSNRSLESFEDLFSYSEGFELVDRLSAFTNGRVIFGQRLPRIMLLFEDLIKNVKKIKAIKALLPGLEDAHIKIKNGLENMNANIAENASTKSLDDTKK